MLKTLDHIYPKQQLIQYGPYILPLPCFHQYLLILEL